MFEIELSAFAKKLLKDIGQNPDEFKVEAGRGKVTDILFYINFIHIPSGKEVMFPDFENFQEGFERDFPELIAK